MAIVVLVVGGLLSILGIAGYIYGLDMMPTERGVAGVISSSVLVVGGVLTLALGLLLRRLEEMSKAVGLALAPPAPVVEAVQPAPVAAEPPADAPIELPKVVPVEAVRPGAPDVDIPAVTIEPRKARFEPAMPKMDLPKMDLPKMDLPKVDLPRPSLKPAAVAAGAVAATVATAAAAKSGLDAVKHALDTDAPAAEPLPESAIAPLNLPRLSPRPPVQAAEKPGARAGEIEYPVEVLQAPEPEAQVLPAQGEPAPVAYAEVPMPAEDKDPFANFEAELDRLLPLKPARPETADESPKPEADKPVETAEVKSEARAESKAEAKAEAKPERKAKSETKSEAKSEAKVEPAPESQAEAKVETTVEPKIETRPERGPHPEPHPAPVVEVATPAEPAPVIAPVVAPVAAATPAPAPGAEVVGAYESGGAKYTMYSDGSVIAEAEGQTMYFKSLEELREFIDGGAK